MQILPNKFNGLIDLKNIKIDKTKTIGSKAINFPKTFNGFVDFKKLWEQRNG